MKLSIIFPMLCVTVLPAFLLAGTAEQQQARVDHLEHAVLAPCCYREPVAIHQSDIALRMRLEIAQWVAMGKSDQEILDTYVNRYGAGVLVDPNTLPRWWMAWIPWIVSVLGVAGGVWTLRRWKSPPVSGAGAEGVQILELPDVEDE